MGEFEVGDVLVLVPKGFLGGDVGAVRPERFAKGDVDGVWVLEFGLELLNMGVEGFFFHLIKLFTSGVDKVVEGYFDKDVAEGRVRRGLKDKAEKGAKVVLEGGGGLGDVVLIDSVERGGPRDGGG